MEEITKRKLVLGPYERAFLACLMPMDDMSDDQLREIVAACDELSETNCSWQLYGIRDAIKRQAKAHLHTNKVRASAIRSRTEGEGK